MFFGGIDGLTSFYTKELIETRYIPSIVLESITIRGNQISNLKDYIILKHNDNNIYIDFFMPDYRNSSKIKYAYNLEGLDEEWIFSKNRNYASYTNLSSGNYDFLVKGRNSSGGWSK